jgi:hypothetical protein
MNILEKEMGQYYKIVFLDEAGTIVRWITPFFPYKCGVKITEHCYLKNPVCVAVEYLLSEGQTFYKSRVVWAGDYADPEPSNDTNLYDICDNELNKQYVGYHDKFEKNAFYVNHTKKLYVDKHKKIHIDETIPIHPLPFLTCEGNGASSSDIHSNSDLLGSWARDVLSVERQVPEGYTELVIPCEGCDCCEDDCD